MEKKTDYTKWKLNVNEGRQFWTYDPLAKEQSIAELYHLGRLQGPKTADKPKSPIEAARRAARFIQKLQTDDGHWAGEYGGPMFLIPGLLIAMYVTGTDIPEEYRIEISRYLKAMAKEQGGWGIHTAGEPTVFGTALNYVALRILGADPSEEVLLKAREFLHKQGGAINIPSWGKFWLSILNVYNWEGVNSLFPELWILPTQFPFHPGKMWCHSRVVALGMSYLYGIKFVARETELIKELRKELYVEDYNCINWQSHRNSVAKVDLYQPHSWVADVIFSLLSYYEPYHNGMLRQKALDECLLQIRMENKNSKSLCIGPVNFVMHIIVMWLVDGPTSSSYLSMVDRIKDYMWMTKDGMLMNGTNGSQLWDTAFIVQAMFECGFDKEKEFFKTLQHSHQFFDVTQIRVNHDNLDRCYRNQSKGAWPFSTRDQGYTVSDTTAEGLVSTLLLQSSSSCSSNLEKKISDNRLFSAVDILLPMQNPNGGFASYELIRGSDFYEWFNISEVYGKIMIEYSYPECTSSVILGLTKFLEIYPDYRKKDIREALSKAVMFLKNEQGADGSWYGSWAICYTYATWFSLEGLSAMGETYFNSITVRKACNFLVSKQEKDGGWGESFKSCESNRYIRHEQSQVVNTSWAILGLMAAQYPGRDVIDKGIKLLLDRQQPSGEWLQEDIEGVFNKNCMISYPNYKLAFPIWALGRYSKRYLNEE